MKAVIEINGNEFTDDVFNRIKSLIGGRTDATVRISIEETSLFPKETKEEYFARLNKSIKEREEGKVVSFTWKEFEEYTRQMLNEP